jgi:CRISPR-associated protein Cmr2
MNKALLSFSLGPVQSFISQARKLHDLFSGSNILSELSNEAMNIAKSHGADIIFPSDKVISKPNVFLALLNIEGKTDDEIREIGNDIENRTKDYFLEIMYDNLDDYYNSVDLEIQLKNYITINQVIYPYDESNSNYYDSFNEVQKLLQETKKTRTFTQYMQQGVSCSICGERVALFYNGKKPRYLNKSKDIAKKIDKHRYKFNSKEALCGVCFSKRLYSTNKSFPSIAQISIMDVIDDLDKDNLKKYKNYFADRYDDELLYEENISENYLKNTGLDNLVSKIEDIKKLLKNVLAPINANNKSMKKYYAVIMSDGDNMGKWISGKFLEDKSMLSDFQNYMSETLGEYGSNLKTYIDGNNRGKVVYNGGDDILAFVNLSHLFDVLNMICDFPDISNNGKYSTTEEFTASAGIVIAHYKTPLSSVLKKVREMEHSAKESGKRNAFALSVMKHSGETLSTVYKWKYDEVNPITLMNDLYKSVQVKNEFSTTFIHVLEKELQSLIDKEGTLGKTVNDKMVEYELKRLMGRSCMMEKREGETKDDFTQRKKVQVKTFSERLYKLFREKFQVNNFLSMLNVIDFMTRKVK